MQDTGVTITDSSTNTDYKRIDVQAVLDTLLEQDTLSVKLSGWGDTLSGSYVTLDFQIDQLAESPIANYSGSFSNAQPGWAFTYSNQVAIGSNITAKVTGNLPQGIACSNKEDMQIPSPTTQVEVRCYPVADLHQAAVTGLY